MATNTLTDALLVKNYIAGDEKSLEILINRHQSKIYGFIYSKISDRNLSDDVFQDTFIKVIKTLKSNSYNEEGKFLPWVMRIAHNACIDHFRKVKRSPSIKTSDDHDIFEVLNFSEAGIDEKMIQGQSHERVRKMLDLLPEDQKEVIIMRHFADLSFKEISALTGCSINTSLGRMRYGLINLRKMMVERQIAL